MESHKTVVSIFTLSLVSVELAVGVINPDEMGLVMPYGEIGPISLGRVIKTHYISKNKWIYMSVVLFAPWERFVLVLKGKSMKNVKKRKK